MRKMWMGLMMAHCSVTSLYPARLSTHARSILSWHRFYFYFVLICIRFVRHSYDYLKSPSFLFFFITRIRSRLSACLGIVSEVVIPLSVYAPAIRYTFNVNSLTFQGKWTQPPLRTLSNQRKNSELSLQKWQLVNANVSCQRKVSYYVSALSPKLTFWQLDDQLDAGSQWWKITILTYVHLLRTCTLFEYSCVTLIWLL